MFVMTDKCLFWWPVKVQVPDPARLGSFLEQSFEARFEALSDGEAAALDEAWNARPAAERQADQNYLLTRVLVDWRQVVGPDQLPVAFSAAALAQALDRSWFRLACLRAYTQAMTGEAARLGN